MFIGTRHTATLLEGDVGGCLDRWGLGQRAMGA